jgi:hypothetical protein
LNVFIHSGSSLEEESREGFFAALAGLGRAARGRSSSLSSSIMMGAIVVAARAKPRSIGSPGAALVPPRDAISLGFFKKNRLECPL